MSQPLNRITKTPATFEHDVAAGIAAFQADVGRRTFGPDSPFWRAGTISPPPTQFLFAIFYLSERQAAPIRNSSMMESFAADIRQALRMMRKSPGFTLTAIAALALGIGANTAIFSVVNAVMLQPLPYPQADRIMKLGRKYPDGIGYSNSIPKYMAWRHNHVFSAMALYDFGIGLNLGHGDRPESVKGMTRIRRLLQSVWLFAFGRKDIYLCRRFAVRPESRTASASACGNRTMRATRPSLAAPSN